MYGESTGLGQGHRAGAQQPVQGPLRVDLLLQRAGGPEDPPVLLRLRADLLRPVRHPARVHREEPQGEGEAQGRVLLQRHGVRQGSDPVRPEAREGAGDRRGIRDRDEGRRGRRDDGGAGAQEDPARLLHLPGIWWWRRSRRSIRTARDYGLKTTFMGTFWSMDKSIIDKLGADAEGYMGVNPYAYYYENAPRDRRDAQIQREGAPEGEVPPELLHPGVVHRAWSTSRRSTRCWRRRSPSPETT